ncbi:MAG: zinc-binding dehydrogenase [Caldilineaceae bacterium]
MTAITQPKRIVPDGPFRLTSLHPGALTELQWLPVERQAPGVGEVELQVHAVALGFRDVLMALGMYPGVDAAAAVKFSGDCAGTIVAVGDGVDHFQVGDEVIGFVPNNYSAFTTTPTQFIAHKPAQLTFTEAVTIPGVFLTASYALVQLAHLAQGERVLIHAATGGVGLAAVQISQQIGAEIFATAGSPEKRAYLHELGITHVLDSRSLAFAEAIMARTNGQGVDVVLNSLAGEFLTRSLEVLGFGGRFLELGKRDIYEHRALDLSPFRRNLAFFAIDVESLWIERPAFVQTLFAELLQRFATGALQPLPYRVFPLTAIVDAFRYMRRANHIGKIVITMQDSE